MYQGTDVGECVAQPLFCVPYAVYTKDANVNGSQLSLRADAQQKLDVFCNLGFRAGSPLPNSSKSFKVECLSDCSYTPAQECQLVTCGVLRPPAVSLDYAPAPYLPTFFDFRQKVFHQARDGERETGRDIKREEGAERGEGGRVGGTDD